jgi:hypothetical protein
MFCPVHSGNESARPASAGLLFLADFLVALDTWVLLGFASNEVATCPAED